ncbi:MAG: L,D-transpeptidase [Coxiellaceae bacterium]|nr:L,D-transpeptidase [Coxiellaceae bacterium]
MKWTAAAILTGGLLTWSFSANANNRMDLLQQCTDVKSCYQITEKLLNQVNASSATHMQVAANSKKKRYVSHRQLFYHLPSRVNHYLGERVFVFSPRLRQWAAYNAYGKRIGYGVANGGSNWCAELRRPCRTPGGSYRIRSKGHAGCVSSKYPLGRGGAKMPYCMFFHKGYAIHGSPHISSRNGSHGCIRVRTPAAQWLHRYFLKHGTKVVVLPYS